MTFEELMKCHPDNRKVYEELLTRFKANRVVPLFGAGMSAWVYPNWDTLMSELCGGNAELKKLVSSKKDCLERMGVIETKMKRAPFRRKLENLFEERTVDERKRPKYQELFPKLFSRVLLTMNFDRLIEALYAGTIDVVNPSDTFDEPCIKKALQGAGDRPILLKLHGDIGNCDKIIATQKDYGRFYGGKANRLDSKKTMPRYLGQVLANNVVLFLGVKLKADRDPAVKMMKRFSATEGQTHFAVMSLTTDETVLGGLKNHGIETIWYKARTDEERNAVHLALFSRLAADLGIGEADDRAFLPVRDLVGREKEVEEVCSYWAAHQEPFAPLVWVSGAGGIGKTELCKAVCKKVAEAGKRAFIPMSDLPTLEGFYAKVLTTLGQDSNKLRPGELAGAATRALEKRCAGGVAYFDNAEDLCDRLDPEGKTEWLKWLNGLRTAKVGVVVSSRMATLFAGRTNCEDVDVKRLADDAAKTLFTAVWGREPEDYESDDYNWLIGQLEGYPLAIVLVALQARARGYLDRAGWEKAAAEISPDDQQSHVSMEIALRTSWKAIQQVPQAVELWGVFHMSVVPLGIEVLKGLFDERVLAVGLGKLQSLGLVYRVEGGTTLRFDMLNPIKKQFLELAGDGVVKAARKRWLAYLRALLPRADQTDVPQEERVTYEQECAAMRTVHGLLPQMWRLLEDLCTAKGLGDVRWLRDEYDMAEKAYEGALAIYREIGNRLGEANALRGLGDMWWLLDENARAEEAYEGALAIYREIGARLGEANVLMRFGLVRWQRGENARAEEAFKTALTISEEIEYKQGCEVAREVIERLKIGRLSISIRGG